MSRPYFARAASCASIALLTFGLARAAAAATVGYACDSFRVELTMTGAQTTKMTVVQFEPGQLGNLNALVHSVSGAPVAVLTRENAFLSLPTGLEDNYYLDLPSAERAAQLLVGATRAKSRPFTCSGM